MQCLDDRRGNPLMGEPAFGGYSYGWQRVRMPFVGNTDTRFRFVLGTDEGNTDPSRYDYAGWAIDDVRLLVQERPDIVAPQGSGLPKALVITRAGSPPPPFSIQARDDSGIDSVVVVYQLEGADGGQDRGALRLEMATNSVTAFSGTVPIYRPNGTWYANAVPIPSV